MGRLKRIKNHIIGARIMLVMGMISIMLIGLILFSCNSGRPLMPGPEFVLFDCDGGYVEVYRYVHNPDKLVFIPFQASIDTCQISRR
jgi:hypothetical protein